ncbi:MAG: HIT family protein [Phycisphaerales bacterium]|jgi:diadenosine tetraphosphate (Ap4A) HIT family hydrolase
MPTNADPPRPSGVVADLAAALRVGDHPRLLARMASGWAVLNERQPSPLRVCAMLVPDPVVASINDLDEVGRAAFSSDLLRIGDALLAATGAERINYLVLCNQAPELHGHAIPRFADEDPSQRRLGPFEAYDFAAAPLGDVHTLPRDLVLAVRRGLGATIA